MSNRPSSDGRFVERMTTKEWQSKKPERKPEPRRKPRFARKRLRGRRQRRKRRPRARSRLRRRRPPGRKPKRLQPARRRSVKPALARKPGRRRPVGRSRKRPNHNHSSIAQRTVSPTRCAVRSGPSAETQGVTSAANDARTSSCRTRLRGNAYGSWRSRTAPGCSVKAATIPSERMIEKVVASYFPAGYA